MRYLPILLRIRNFLLCCSTLVLVGCAESEELSSSTAVKLRRLASVYLDYAVAKGVGPAGEKQLCAHAPNVPCFEAAAAASDPLAKNSALVSERDGQEFVVRYGCRVCLRQGDDAPPIAFESAGMAGTRLVAFANGKVACVEEEQVKALLSTYSIADVQTSHSRRGGTGL